MLNCNVMDAPLRGKGASETGSLMVGDDAVDHRRQCHGAQTGIFEGFPTPDCEFFLS